MEIGSTSTTGSSPGRAPLLAGLFLQALALCGGCATTSPSALGKYQPPPEGAPASVIEVGPHTHAWAVDGAETPALASMLRMTPGEHRVGINCYTTDFADAGVIMSGRHAPAAPLMSAKTTLQFVLVTGAFEPGKTYYTRCATTADGQPRAWLADAPDSNDLPQGFTSICTRECPREDH